jgi:hypothetical protein
MLKNNLTFVYPFKSYSTNCSDSGGTHIKNGTYLYQTALALQSRPQPIFNYCPIDFYDVAYDSFMEPVGDVIELWLGLNHSEVEVDFNGTKPIELLLKKPYALTLKKGKIAIKNYSHNFRPVEFNLKNPTQPDAFGYWNLVKTDQLSIYSKNNGSLDLLSYQSHINYFHFNKLTSLIYFIIKIIPSYTFSKFNNLIIKFFR